MNSITGAQLRARQ